MSRHSDRRDWAFPDYLRADPTLAARAELLADFIMFLVYEKPMVLRMSYTHRQHKDTTDGFIRGGRYTLHATGEIGFGSGRVTFEANEETRLHFYIRPCRTYVISNYTPDPEAESWLFSLSPLEALAVASR